MKLSFNAVDDLDDRRRPRVFGVVRQLNENVPQSRSALISFQQIATKLLHDVGDAVLW